MTFVDGCSESVRLNVLLKMEVMVEEQGQEGGKTGSYKLIPWPYDGLCARRRLFQLEVGTGSKVAADYLFPSSLWRHALEKKDARFVRLIF